MDVEPTKSGWILALGAVLLLAGMPAMAQKKPGGGGTADCATAVDFPSFIFYRTSGSTGATYVADRSGQCVRLVGSGIHSYQNAFSYPVRRDDIQPINKGRIVWNDRGADGSFNAFYALDFEVTGTQVTVGPKYLVKDFGPNTPFGHSVCCGIDLSRDGRSLYVSVLPSEDSDSVTHRVVRLPLPDDLTELAPATQSVVTLYTAPESPPPGPAGIGSGVTRDLAVDFPEQNLYLVRGGIDMVDELVRVELTTSIVSELTGPRSDYGSIRQPRYPAAEPALLSTRVAFREWIGDTTSRDCDKLYFVDGVSGVITEPTTVAYADNITWVGGKVLANGFNSRCGATGRIVEIDPSSGAARELVAGYHPEGR